MPFIFALGIVMIGAYLLQAFLGYRQIKHFTRTYTVMKKKGRVAIGRRSGKFKAGTIVMFAIDQNAQIIEAKKIQGTTVLAKFKTLPEFEGYKLPTLSLDTPIVQKQNKLTQETIMDAVSLYEKFSKGEEILEKEAPFNAIGTQLSLVAESVKGKIKRSVN